MTGSLPVTFDGPSGPKSHSVPPLWWCRCVCGTHVSAPLVTCAIGGLLLCAAGRQVGLHHRTRETVPQGGRPSREQACYHPDTTFHRFGEMGLRAHFL